MLRNINLFISNKKLKLFNKINIFMILKFIDCVFREQASNISVFEISEVHKPTAFNIAYF